MSREIKFRAWSTEFKKMFNVEEIRWDMGGGRLRSIGAYRFDEHGHAEGTWDDRIVRSEGNFKFLILMQSTGLMDKNGKEIYEGDIVRHRFHSTNPPHEMFEVGRIIWNQPNCRFSWYSRDGGDGYGLQEKDDEYREIVGNIHETPELVKA